MSIPSVTREQQVIDAARTTRAAITDLEIQQLRQAVEWVELHPGDQVDTSIAWGMRDLEIAGDGAPTIDEGAVAEFALAIGVSTDSGRLYLGDAVELKHRLPRIWAKVTAGVVPVWKARKVAQATRSLPEEGAAFVDRALYFVLKKCSFAEIDRQVDKARAEFDPEAAEERRRKAAEKRRFDVHLRDMTHGGLVPVTGMLDLADAVALNERIAAKAATLDPALPLDVRRAAAAGMLGDTDQGHDVTIYAHLRPDQAMVDVDNTRSVITPEHLKEWCQAAGTTVTVKPVIDLNEEITTDSYQPTERQKEQTRLRWPTCPFPHCDRPSWRQGPNADNDHIVEWPAGATTTSNLAPPCRGHHRLKTFTAWAYRRIPGLGWEWTSPLGHRHIG
ncbi:HNH endonuclease signature motif containing protein [Nocardioides aquiterrae]|uniref:DUF222 domain-containing protein n=1 Tax=Nocardioides aquiterrae TaxID=203799 RepID=A0ABP4EVP4_9ACTN